MSPPVNTHTNAYPLPPLFSLHNSRIMDIGFGDKNQIIGNMVNKVMLEGAEQQEAQIDADMAKYDELMNDEDALERLRAKRKEKLIQDQKKRLDWQAQGHGRYMELSDTKEFFHAAKTSQRLVVHFYRPTTRYCENVDAHFEKLCKKVRRGWEGDLDGMGCCLDRRLHDLLTSAPPPPI